MLNNVQVMPLSLLTISIAIYSQKLANRFVQLVRIDEGKYRIQTESDVQYCAMLWAQCVRYYLDFRKQGDTMLLYDILLLLSGDLNGSRQSFVQTHLNAQ